MKTLIASLAFASALAVSAPALADAGLGGNGGDYATTKSQLLSIAGGGRGGVADTRSAAPRLPISPQNYDSAFFGPTPRGYQVGGGAR